MTTSETWAAVEPNRVSVTLRMRKRRIGSSETSSRPESAVRSPSRWMSSVMSEKDVVGGMSYDVRGKQRRK